MKLHHIKIVQIDVAEGKPWSSLDTKVFLDGKELQGVRNAHFYIDAKSGLSGVKMDILSSVEMEGNVAADKLQIVRSNKEGME